MHLLSKIRLAVFFCLMSVSAHAWNLPTGSYQFESIADRVYVMHGPLGEPSKDNQGFMNNPAHTDTDIMIEHVGSQTIFMGDNSFSNRIGRFDGSGSIVETIKALKYIAAQSFKTVVPGHGPSANPEQALNPYLDYLLKLESVVAQGQEDELEDYEIKAATLDQFENWNSWVGFEKQFGPNLNKMFLELEDF